jgi:bifunctional non-homologous end joining protein LigD
LWLDGDNQRGLPLIERKRRLRRLIQASRCSRALFADHVEAHGTDLFQAICERDCEGIIAKHKLAPYASSPQSWFKVLNTAYTQARGRGEMFDNFRNRRSMTVVDAALNGDSGRIQEWAYLS